MTTWHSTQQLVGGDDWSIPATLLDDAGQAYDLTGAQILWTITDDAGQRFIEPVDYTVTLEDAIAGKCLIEVKAAKTTTVRAGRFTQSFRIVATDGSTVTPLVGLVQVVVDPWRTAGGYQFHNVA
jgi:hypothetical protein